MRLRFSREITRGFGPCAKALPRLRVCCRLSRGCPVPPCYLGAGLVVVGWQPPVERFPLASSGSWLKAGKVGDAGASSACSSGVVTEGALERLAGFSENALLGLWGGSW